MNQLQRFKMWKIIFENFRKPIHFGGEPVILQLVDNFDANLNQILSYVDNFSDAQLRRC